jgi:DNA (cytosine-5)-methyltransferase 1
MNGDSSVLFYEFFSGGGLARLGLEPDFACAFANDFDPEKQNAYRAAFAAIERQRLVGGDIWALSAADLPGQAALAWASFPCQDLSLAGARRGLAAPRSGAFWGFHRLIEKLANEGRAPPLLALENVTGLLTSHAGADFAALVNAIDGLGYRVGALVVDAAWFTPQSRPRLFIVAARKPAPPLIAAGPNETFHPKQLRDAVNRLAPTLRKRFVWWRLPEPPRRNTQLADLLDEQAAWDAPEQTARLIALMSPRQRDRLDAMRESGAVAIGAAFRRIRIERGERVQRLEARFDGLAGCLRTPSGGSSRQFILEVRGGAARTRLLSPREAARLMGVPDDYPLPPRANAALHLFGDAVCVPAVRWLSHHLLAPLARAGAPTRT